jgi:hypothetical protein
MVVEARHRTILSRGELAERSLLGKGGLMTRAINSDLQKSIKAYEDLYLRHLLTFLDNYSPKVFSHPNYCVSRVFSALFFLR